jgi:hypothetical protein
VRTTKVLICCSRGASLYGLEVVNVSAVMADITSIKKRCSVSVSQSKALRFLVVYIDIGNMMYYTR